MKKILIFSITVYAVFFSSCTKQLELNPKDALTTEIALSTLAGVNSAVVGMYAKLRDVNYYGRSVFIYGDLSADDIYLSVNNSNRYSTTFQRSYAGNDANVLATWTAIYSVIARANNIINSVDKVTGSQADKDFAKGQALFIRALGYFDLLKIYAKPYNQGNGSQPGVPIVLISDVTNYPARNTVAEGYTQIINDLNSAKALLTATSASDKFTISTYAASALLSRVYLYKGDNANAIAAAKVVTDNTAFGVTAVDNLPTFYTTSGNKEEIFTVKFNATESLGSDNLGQIYLKPGYGDLRVSPDLIAIFDKAKDSRYINFIRPFTGSPKEFENAKFTGEAGQLGMYSTKVLRLSEVYLNKAEAESKAGGQDSQALADLNAVKTNRGLAPVSGLTGTALLNEILLERRKEFMFEGQRFFDLTRNGLTMTRSFCNDPLAVNSPQCSLAATDPKVVAPIPQSEIDANKSLTGQQNQGY